MAVKHEAETRVAAEFTQTAFESARLDIQVGGGSNSERMKRVKRKRSQPVESTIERNQPQSDGNVVDLQKARSNFEVYLYDCGLTKGQAYKVTYIFQD